MIAAKLNWFLCVLFLASLVVNWTMGIDPAQPNVRIPSEMADPIAYGAFAANSNFADGKTLRAPAPNTIARGHLPLHYKATPEDAARAGQTLQNPLKLRAVWEQANITVAFNLFGPLPHLSAIAGQAQIAAARERQQRQRGAYLFANFCQTCHGATGAGDGPVTKRGMPPPPSLLAEKALQMKDGQMFHVQTYGQGNMASYASQVSAEDRWLAIMHIRTLQEPAVARKGG